MLSFTLAIRPPYDWPSLRAYLAARATPGVEAIGDDGRYWRTMAIDGRAGVVAIGGAGNALRVEASDALADVARTLAARLRRTLDTDVDGAAVNAALACDPTLAPLVARRPGLRVPGAPSGFELALRAVLGQQVSVAGATTLAGRLAARVGEPIAVREPGAPASLGRLAVTAERLVDAGVDAVAAIGLPRKRAECLAGLARAAADGELPELTAHAPLADLDAWVARFTALSGIGPWTAQYVAMRALRCADAFPDGDLALRRAMGGLPARALRAASAPWRPWRAYAAVHLWASLA